MSLSSRSFVAALAVVLAAAGAAGQGAVAHGAVDGPPASTAGQARAEAQSPIAGPGVGNVAHRGASLNAPENTMAAMRQAIARGADFVGIDVRRTLDGQLVVLHDQGLARTTDVEQIFPGRQPWLVEDFTLAEIRQLDAGSWLSPTFFGERVPTLRQVLEELEPSTTGVFLEIKQPQRYDGVPGIGAQVMDEISTYTSWLDGEPGDKVVIQAFSDTFVQQFVETYPEVAVGTLGPVDRMQQYKAWGVDQVNVHHSDVLDPGTRLVAEAHALGLEVSTYVVNDVPTMHAVLDEGVDAVSTDQAGDLNGVLTERDQRFRDPPPPPAQPYDVRWSLSLPATARKDERIPLDARMETVSGNPARWAWVLVEHRTTSGWRPLQRSRVTDRFGELHTTVRARPGLKIRMKSVASPWYVERVSEVRRVTIVSARTQAAWAS
ncbi:MAG: glycerophosphodiester phosphodiesterase [Nocardioidaceae bacterium]